MSMGDEKKRLLDPLLQLLILFLFLNFAASRFIVEKSSLTIVSPDSLRGTHDAAIGNFGVPEYGGTLLGSLYYPSMYSRDNMGCDEFPKPFPRANTKIPFIVLIDRGGCLFALKVYHAQMAGANAVLVADDRDEPLITMDSPEEETNADQYIGNISIPSALITKAVGDSLRSALTSKTDIMLKIDWRESMPHPDDRVEFQLWTNTNDECGPRCDEQVSFVSEFRGHAQILEKDGYTQFTPHYITWYCPKAFTESRQCKSQCINNGRYCAPDPEMDFTSGYEGKDVLIENLRSLCVHKVANETGKPGVWWDYVSDFHVRCSMKEKKYTKNCGDDVIKTLSLPLDKVVQCMGDPVADKENDILSMEQELQVGKGTRGDVTILPTLVINDVQYRGKLERTSVLKAICAGFKEGTEPRLCLTGDLETNECLENNGGCWQDEKKQVTACKDTFRGRVCECPVVNGVQYKGDGYVKCEAVGPARCAVNHGGCWAEMKNGQNFSACIDTELEGCKCPPGFRGDGHACVDIDECAEHLACHCDSCHCKNTFGSYDCSCSGDRLYIKDQDTCIGKSSSKSTWLIVLLVLTGFAGIGLAGYIFYRYRLRSYMDSEIMAIMSQYMPLDNQNNESDPLRHSTA